MQRSIDALCDGVFDLLILGGGITGAGVALDSALRGFRTALIDKADFASGTSSVSSKLVHGGLRYLEHAEFRLVYEALHERRRLLTNAPHIVHPLRFVLPFYTGTRVPGWKWRVGLFLYDFLAGRGNIQRSRLISLAALRRDYPQLRPANLTGGAEYWDAQMDDARLCITVLRSAAQAGAVVANYVEAAALEKSAGAVSGARAVDRLGGKEFTIRARVVLNAGGPWVDAVNELAGESVPPMLQPTKGVHLIAADLGHPCAYTLLHPRDGRVFFVIPWLGKTLIGTTDTLCIERPDALTATSEDVDYLLAAYNHYFTPELKAEEILSTFVGLRPLIRARTGDPSAMTRESRITTLPSGLITVAGGKYTTFRHMAEQVTDEIARRLGRRRPCRTADHRLDGAPEGPWEEAAARLVSQLVQSHRLEPAAAEHLVHRYGTRAQDVASYLTEKPELSEPVVAGEPELRVEFVYQRACEMAMTAADCYLRRTRLGMFHPEAVPTEG